MTRQTSSPMALLGSVLLASSGCTTTSSASPALPGGTVMGWGGNSVGQIGDGTASQRLTPVPVPSLQSVQAIAASGDSSMALTTDGRVFVWGDGTAAPAEMAAVRGARAIAAGRRHRLALMPDGSVQAWGENGSGQLGDTSTTARPSPVQVVGLSGVVAIAASGDQSYAVGPGFGLWSWGGNGKGQLGSGSTTPRSQPARVGALQVIEVTASPAHALALTTDGELFGWGGNDTCQLMQDPATGLITTIQCSSRPTPTRLLAYASPGISTTGAALAATGQSSLWVTSSGGVQATGADGSDSTYSGLCAVDAILGMAAYVASTVNASTSGIAAGGAHVLLRTDKGEVWALGANGAGQLGRGSPSPVECGALIPSSSIRGAVALAAGTEHSLALVRGILEASPAGTLDLGRSNLGKPPTGRSLTLRNVGLAPVTFAGVRTIGSDFGATDTCPRPPAGLAPGTACDVALTFEPAAVGARAGVLEVTSNAFERSARIPLSGTGTEPRVAFAPASLDLGSAPVGATTASGRATVTNAGDGPLEISGLLTTAGFSLVADSCPRPPAALAPQASCDADVTFGPTQQGPAVGELQLSYQGRSAAMTLRGTGQ